MGSVFVENRWLRQGSTGVAAKVNQISFDVLFVSKSLKTGNLMIIPSTGFISLLKYC